VREEAIYSGGRLAGGWSAGRQVVCLRHNRTGRTCDTYRDGRKDEIKNREIKQVNTFYSERTSILVLFV
jgi:hypothetical protein